MTQDRSQSNVFRLYVATDNAAFDSDPRHEVTRILRECADRIEREGVGFPSQTIRDVNGNDVGRYAIKTQAQWNG